MPATALPPPPVSAPPSLAARSYRLRVPQYLEMVGRGILTISDRVELLEGHLVTKMVKNPPHVLAGRRTFDTLRRVTPAGRHVAKEDPVTTPDSVPEPDCSIIRGVAEDYRDRLADARDVALVVEVADSSLLDDQRYMRILYARAAIPFYWIVNIPDARLEVYSDPTGPTHAPDYRTRLAYGPDQDVPLVLDGREAARIVVRELLP